MSRETAADVADDRQMLVSFDVAGQEFAFALDVVLEVLDAPETLAALPASEELVLGVTPFRDTLAAAAVAARPAGLPPQRPRATAARRSSSRRSAARWSDCWPTACARSSPPMPV